MKNFKKLAFISLIALLALTNVSCRKVPAGNVGIKFYLLGTNKGVDFDVVEPGWVWLGVYKELYLFPTFTQNYVWTKEKDPGSPTDESFNFQDKDGLELNADIGITYRIDPQKVPDIFQKYKRGVDEITDIFLRNMVRDALVTQSSKLTVEQIYGEERENFIIEVTDKVKSQVSDLGIIVEKIYWIGRIKLPENVKQAVDDKIKATQTAQLRENEVREAEAKAKIAIALAEGEARAILLRAQSQAEANRILAASITPNLIDYEKLQKWNGVLPQVQGSNANIVQLPGR